MGSECYVSAIYVGEIDAEEIGLSVTRGSTSDLKTNTKVSVFRKELQPWLNSACMALLVHLLVLILLALSWEKAEIRLGADAVKEPKKVSAYFITPEQLTRLMVIKTLTPPAPIEPEVMLGKNIKANPIIADGTDNVIKPQTAPNASHEASKPAETQTKPSSKNEALKQSNAINTLSVTGDYLRRQEQQAFEKMVSEYGHRASMPSGASLSEMTPEMPRYEVKIIEDKIQPRSLNHRLDPNRIVKVGDTCYRVVNLSTQINPHGEGLGFARPCDPVDPSKRALDAAIGHRLSKMKSN